MLGKRLLWKMEIKDEVLDEWPLLLVAVPRYVTHFNYIWNWCQNHRSHGTAEPFRSLRRKRRCTRRILLGFVPFSWTTFISPSAELQCRFKSCTKTIKQYNRIVRIVNRNINVGMMEKFRLIIDFLRNITLSGVVKVKSPYGRVLLVYLPKCRYKFYPKNKIITRRRIDVRCKC